MGLSAEDLLEFYRKRGLVIFLTMSLVERSLGLLRQLFVGPKLSREILKRELSADLKDGRFGEARCRLAIPSYHAVRGRIYVSKTPHNSSLVNDIDTPAVDVALATSAAPTYFAAASANRDAGFATHHPRGDASLIFISALPYSRIKRGCDV